MKSLTLAGLVLAAPLAHAASFNQVWDVVKTPARDNMVYAENLPRRTTTYADLLRAPYTIYVATKRALEDTSDLFPENTKKLIRYNGICLAGKWKITEDTPYTGMFARGAEGLIIARASVGFDETTRGEYRSFGIAGKVFPTTDPDADVTAGNFFLIDDNGGTRRSRFVTAPLLSEAKLSYFNIAASTVRDFSVDFIRRLTLVNRAQQSADRESKIRQLYPLSRAGVANPEDARSPALLKVVGAASNPRVDRNDFRDELRVANYPEGLRFDIHVAQVRADRPRWTRVGQIEFTQDTVSDACDQRLRFAHPWWDPNAK